VPFLAPPYKAWLLKFVVISGELNVEDSLKYKDWRYEKKPLIPLTSGPVRLVKVRASCSEYPKKP
jgi:hypothetical protein